MTRHDQAIGDLAWSPDGTRIAYIDALRPGEPGRGRAAGRTRRRRCASPGASTTSRTAAATWATSACRSSSSTSRAASGGSVTQRGGRPRLPALVAGRPDARGAALAPQRHVLATGADRRRDRRDDAGRAGAAASVGAWAWSPSRRPDHLRRRRGADLAARLLRLRRGDGGEPRRLTDDLPCLPDAGYPGDAARRRSRSGWTSGRCSSTPSAPARAACTSIDSETGAVEPVAALAGAARRPERRRRRPLRRAGAQRAWTRSARSPSTTSRATSATVITDYNAPVLARVAAGAAGSASTSSAASYTIEAWLLKPPDFDPAEAVPGRPGRPRRAATASTATASTPLPAVPGDQRLPGRLRQPARLVVLRPRLHPAGDRATGAARTTST